MGVCPTWKGTRGKVGVEGRPWKGRSEGHPWKGRAQGPTWKGLPRRAPVERFPGRARLPRLLCEALGRCDVGRSRPSGTRGKVGAEGHPWKGRSEGHPWKGRAQGPTWKGRDGSSTWKGRFIGHPWKGHSFIGHTWKGHSGGRRVRSRQEEEGGAATRASQVHRAPIKNQRLVSGNQFPPFGNQALKGPRPFHVHPSGTRGKVVGPTGKSRTWKGRPKGSGSGSGSVWAQLSSPEAEAEAEAGAEGEAEAGAGAEADPEAEAQELRGRGRRPAPPSAPLTRIAAGWLFGSISPSRATPPHPWRAARPAALCIAARPASGPLPKGGGWTVCYTSSSAEKTCASLDAMMTGRPPAGPPPTPSSLVCTRRRALERRPSARPRRARAPAPWARRLCPARTATPRPASGAGRPPQRGPSSSSSQAEARPPNTCAPWEEADVNDTLRHVTTRYDIYDTYDTYDTYATYSSYSSYSTPHEPLNPCSLRSVWHAKGREGRGTAARATLDWTGLDWTD
eukprot:gene7863-biopygen13556